MSIWSSWRDALEIPPRVEYEDEPSTAGEPVSFTFALSAMSSWIRVHLYEGDYRTEALLSADEADELARMLREVAAAKRKDDADWAERLARRPS